MVFLAESLYPRSGYREGSADVGESLFHHSVPLFVGHQLSAQLCVLILELPHTVPEGVGGVLLLFVSDSKEDAEDGDEDKGDVEQGLSFRRIFNIGRVYIAKKRISLDPMAGSLAGRW